MKLIALEEHYSAPEVHAAWDALSGPLQDPVISLAQSAKIRQQLADLSDARLQHMGECGIDVQVLSLTTPAWTGCCSRWTTRLSSRPGAKRGAF